MEKKEVIPDPSWTEEELKILYGLRDSARALLKSLDRKPWWKFW